jgi:polyferredoxin
MDSDALYRLGADLVLVAHFGVVTFVVGGLALILAGNRCGWAWVNGWYFRASHVVAIAVVAAQAWLGVVCPLTALENWLRSRGGGGTYDESFVAHWLRWLLFYDVQPAVFTALYTVFGAAVLAAWWWFPPRRRRR